MISNIILLIILLLFLRKIFDFIYPSKKNEDEKGPIENGLFKTYLGNDKDLLLTEENYKDFKKHGLFKQYSFRGGFKGELSEETNYKNGRMDGLDKSYYKSGKLKYEGEYKDDMRNGFLKSYYENGQIGKDENYVNDLHNGLCKYYYENGQLRYERNFKSGEKHGEHKYFHEDGKLIEEVIYKDGSIDEYIYFYRNGNYREKREKLKHDFYRITEFWDDGWIKSRITYDSDSKIIDSDYLG